MADKPFGLIEVVGVFLLVLGFGLWQLRSTRRAIAEREAREAARRAAPPSEPGPSP